MGRLIVICGLPGSGKTTLARRLETDYRAIRMCPDEWMAALQIDLYDEAARARIEALQWKLGQGLLRLEHTVIIEWGTWGRNERDVLRLGARDLGAVVELRYLTASREVLWQRVRDRGLENPPIQRCDLDRWIESFQAPTDEELRLFDAPVFE